MVEIASSAYGLLAMTEGAVFLSPGMTPRAMEDSEGLVNMSRLALFLLGPPRIECNGEPIEIDRRKAIALIAYLAVTGRSHSRDALATLLWPEYDQSRARAGLRRALSALKEALGGGWLDVDREAVGLKPDAEVWLDVGEFQDRLAECQTHGHPQEEVCPACLPPLAEAAALYRDHFLVGFTLRDSPNFDEWQFFQTEGLRDELASALERLTHAHSAQGEFEQAIAYARRWLGLDPLHEPAHRCLMQLYAWSGQRAAALRQYRECERVLKEELGVPPEEETTQIYEAIKENRDLPSPVEGLATPVLPQTATRKHNLPVQLTPFVGREAALAEIADRLQDPACRLLTLVGPGGSGKTRLALEAAAAQVDHFAHGVFFVPLAPLDSVEAIVPTVAEALGFRSYEEGKLQQQLLDYLCQKTMLLILDNFEHLLDGVGVVTDILKMAPDVKTLIASRARLNVQGEHLFPVAGMDFPALTPDPSPIFVRGEPKDAALRRVHPEHSRRAQDAARYSAIKLFLQGARRAQPGFELTTANWMHVIRICHLVEGMPLGILLAAAWVEILTPAEIAAEIGQGLDFLETDLHDVPERQRSMRAVFDHSWRLLTEREREVFQGLSVFRGSFTHQAAGQVTGASLRELRALVNKSLLHRMPTPSASPSTSPLDSARDELRAGLGTGGRYEVHELLRQYAAEKLDQSPAASETTRDRHSAYYAAALQGWAADLKGPRQQAAMAEIEADSENARAAWNWALERGQVERLEQAMEGLCCFYEWRGRYPAVIAAAQAAIHLAQAAQAVRGEAGGYLWWGRTLWHQGNYEMARLQLEQALALARAAQLRQVEADSLRNLGIISHHQADDAGAIAYYEQALHIYREIGDQPGESALLNNLGNVYADQGDDAGARACYEQSLRICREIGDRYGDGMVLGNLGIFSHRLGDYAGAMTYYEQSLCIYREIGERRGEGFTLAYLGLLSHHLGDDEAAREYSQQALLIAQELGNRHIQGYALTNLGHALAGLELLAEAAEAYRQALILRRELDQHHLATEPLAGLACVCLAQGNLHQAQAQIEEVLGHLETQTPSTGSGHGLDGTDEPFRVYLTCYRVLRANQDPRAQVILDTAYSLLQEQAAKISDEELRRSFLENVAAHREIVEEMRTLK